MSEKQVKVRIAMDGGKAVEAQLEGIGQKGKASMQAIGQSSGAMRANVQNASYQVQDFFVQVASGTDASRALAQQLPQLLGSLGLFGVLAGTAAAMLIPLGSHIFGVGEEAETAEKQIKTLNEAVSALKQATSAANSSPTDLFAQYGAGAEKAREILEIQREMASIEAEMALGAAAKSLADSFGVVTGRKNEIAEIADIMDRIRANGDVIEFDDITEIAARLNTTEEQALNIADAMLVVNDSVATLAASFGVTSEQAAVLADMMEDVQSAGSPEEQAAAMAALRDYIMQATEGGKGLNEEAQRLLKNLTDSELRALALAQIDIASGINAAASSAGELARQLGISVALASQMMARGYTGKKQEVIFDPRDPKYNATAATAARLAEEAGRISPFDPSRLPKPGAGTKGSGGGVSDEQKARNDMLREAQRLYEQTRTDAEKYTAEVANLDAMLKAGVIDQDLYNRGLARAAEQYGEATGAAAFFKEMNIDIKETLIDVALEGGSALDGLIEKLKRAAVEAALFGSGPIAKLFGMSGGGLFGDLFAAPLAGSKASGGPVERGRAYRVGEMGPEIFMPNANGTILPSDPMSERRMPQGATTAAAAAQPVRLEVSLGDGLVARILDQAQAQAVRVVQKSLTAYDSQVLPARMQQISADPRRKG